MTHPPDIDELLARVQHEADGIELVRPPEPVEMGETDQRGPDQGQPGIAADSRRVFTLAELVAPDEHEFIPHLFQCLLDRAPEPQAAQYYRGLREQGATRTELVLELLSSPEARDRRVRVRGLGSTRWLAPIARRLNRYSPQRLRVQAQVSESRQAKLARTLARRLPRPLMRLAEGTLRLTRIPSRLVRRHERKRMQKPGFILDRLLAHEARLDELVAVPRHIDELRVHFEDINGRVEGLANDRDRLVQDQDELMNRATTLIDELRGRLDGLTSDRDELRDDRDQLSAGLVQLRDDMHAAFDDHRGGVEQLAVRQARTHTELQVVDEKLSHVDITLDWLRFHVSQMRHRAPLPTGEGAAVETTPPGAPEEWMDRFYIAFEDACRGSEEQIRETQREYLELVEHGPVADGLPLMDIGCGRGEWLELLQQAGHSAFGIDLSPAMVERAAAHGLDVQQADLIPALVEQRDATLGAVTAFHVIEHLPFPVLYRMFSESLRVLAPGGQLICETPNPENILVGSHTFYHDPTHRNPITPTFIQFLAEYTGFADIEIRRLHPYPESARVPGDDPLTERINGHLTGPQDFALIARRPSAQ